MPRNIDTVISPSACGSTLIWRLDASFSAALESQIRSRNAGVYRNSGTCCSRNTLTPPNRTCGALTFGSSVVVGV